MCVEDIVFDCEAFSPFSSLNIIQESVFVCVSVGHHSVKFGIIKEIRQNAGLIVYLRVLLAGPVRRNH